MGLRGPKMMPTMLKIARGNPGKRPLPKDEPQPGEFAAEPPGYLGQAGREEWARLVPILKRMRILTEADYLAVGVLLRAFETWTTAQGAIAKHGLLMKTPSGYPIQNPALSIARKQEEVMLRLLPQFGMTSSGRAGLHVEKEQAKPENRFSKFGAA